MNAKMLHKHSLPVISLAVAALAITASGAAAIAASGQSNRPALADSLTHSAVKVQGTSNGMAKISSSAQLSTGGLAGIDNTTETAQIFFALHQSE